MLSVISHVDRAAHEGVLADMHHDRKRVFVDLLKWDIPVLEEKYEIDQFDDANAIYLVVTDSAREVHLGSVRLLPSVRPHILGDIFPQLCSGTVPRGDDVWEITRLCISPDVISMRQGMQVRRQLAIGLTEFALLHGIERYTLVSTAAHLPQLLAIGWDCEPLGLPTQVGDQLLCATQINVTPATLAYLRQSTRTRRPVLDLRAEPLAMAA